MRWRLLGLFFFAMAGATAWTFWIRPDAEIWLKNKIQTELSRRLGREVRLDSLAIHPLLFNVQARGVRVGPLDNPLFVCSRWTFHTAYAGDATPFALFSLTLGRSELENPVVRVGGMGGSSSGLSFSSLQKIPLHRLTWAGGEVRVAKSSTTPALVLSDASGDLQLTPRSVSLKARADFGEGAIRLDVQCDRPLFGSPRMDVEATLSLSNFPLDPFSGTMGPRWGTAAGRVNGALRAKWNRVPLDSVAMDPADFLRTSRWSGDLHVDGLWTPPGSGSKDRGVPLAGNVTFTNEGLERIDVRFFQTLGVSGTVRFPSGEAQLRWRGESVPLAVLAQSGLRPLRGLPSRGTLDTEGEFSGAVAASRGAWTARVRGMGVPGFLIPEFSVQGNWDKNYLFVSAKGMGGAVELTRDGAVQRRPRWRGTAAGLDLGVLAEHNGWRRVGGTMDASFSMALGENPGLFPEAEGKLRIDRFSWTGHRETAPVEGLFQMGAMGARVQGVGGNFDVEITERSKQWRVERFHYDSGAMRISAQGFLKDADGNIGLEARVDGFPLSYFPFLTKRFPDVEGRLSLSGRVQGQWGDPLAVGHFSADEIRWRAGGLLHRAQGLWRGGRSGITLTEGTWDDSVRAEGTWLFGKGGQLTAELRRTSAEKMVDFWRGSGTVSGTVSGGLSVRVGSDQKPQGWARFTVERGRWNNFNFEALRTVAFVRNDRMDLETLSLRTKEGTFDCRGSVNKRQGRPGSAALWDWDGSGWVKKFPGPWISLSSSWTARGTWLADQREGRGTWSSPSVVVGETTPLDAGSVQLTGSWNPDKIRLDEVRVQRGLRGEASISRIDGRVAGRFEIKDLSVPALFPNARLFHPGADGKTLAVLGPLSGAGTLGGTWRNPTAEGRFALAESRWKEMSFVGETRAAWDRFLDVTHALIRFTDGGGIEGTGRWVPGPVPEARLNARLIETPLAPLLKSVGVPMGAGGVVEGTLFLSGPVRALSGTAGISAEGFGPKSEPLSAKGQFTVAGSSVHVKEAHVKTPEGFWRVRPGGWAAFSNKGRVAFQFTSDIRNLKWGPLRIFGGAGFQGTCDIQSAALSGAVAADGLWINQHVFDGDLARFGLTREALTFENVPGASTFLKGRVRLARWPQLFFENLTLWKEGERKLVMAGEMGPDLWDFTLQGRGLEADALLPLADIQWPLTGPWDVRVRGRGSFQQPDLSADISGGPGALGPLPYDRITAQAHWIDGAVHVAELNLVRRKGYRVTGAATIPVRQGDGWEKMELNVRLEEGKAVLLEDVWPLCRSARGNFWGELSVKPGGRVPHVTGFLSVQEGRLRLNDYVPRATDINGEIRFQNDRARVERARARVGKGWIEMAGDVGIRGLEPVEYDLSIQTDGTRGVSVEVPQLSVPPGPLLGRFSFLSEKLKGITTGEPRLSLRVKGTHGQHTIAGSVELERTHFTYPPSKTARGELQGPRWWKNFWRQARWDVLLKTAKDTWYRNEYVDVKLRGQLALVGRPGDWSAHGRVDADEGMINYLGQLFKVNRGAFELINDPRPGLGGDATQAYLSGEAQRTVTTVDRRGLATDDTIFMVVDRALIADLQPRFVSRNNPDMKSDRVAMKALGVSADQPFTQADRDQLLKAGMVQLAGSSAAPAANRLAQKFGIDMISPIYEPPASQEEAPTVASVNKPNAAEQEETLSEYLRGAGASARVRLTDRLSGVYKVKLDETKDQTYFRDQIELILQVKGSVYMRASTELDSQSLLGQPPERRLALENVWRFGTLPWRRGASVQEPGK